jgi:3'-phosphoadenosine 5'-phosphosulfate sulfotransferase (PAPS reductase)/FAD synthetase
MPTPIPVLDLAVADYQPAGVFGMFSGGHDSLCSTHIAAQHPSFSGVLHVNTGIGIEETREYVRQTCDRFGWRLYEVRAPEGLYERRCLQYGMPGGPVEHGIMYQLLKDEQVRIHVRTHKGRRGGKVGLVTGIRAGESNRRMRVYPTPIRREFAQLWINPILDWSARDVNDYIAEHDLPRNPVVDKLHRSGECLCGALARPEELDEIGFWYPDVARRIRDLERTCYERGLPHRWGADQAQKINPNQPWLPLCQDCPTRWESSEPASSRYLA